MFHIFFGGWGIKYTVYSLKQQQNVDESVSTTGLFVFKHECLSSSLYKTLDNSMYFSFLSFVSFERKMKAMQQFQ